MVITGAVVSTGLHPLGCSHLEDGAASSTVMKNPMSKAMGPISMLLVFCGCVGFSHIVSDADCAVID